ncbi:hypothetical protein [Sporosarcina pasteurii]|uniref:N-acetyltransferase domain-containing protein n=1 Tax=Sporosarcina pasteurii TaxID=1474 RepID=A0A380BQR8_SPOPA|nr:hypothetical protein [Sporosarcina pasteurii]MDS9471175.1 hypothetical protein [Sporosarcina pasteurii]QBQ05186.1 hypothetical protein E2C16_05660 [Sporosarcina pasteurii]SUJ05416.1 Uncharacterised protein [Sporosarcina pasteurii]
MFNYAIDEDTELKLLDECDAGRLFLLIDSSMETLRNWLSWIDRTKAIDDTRAYIKDTLQHADNNDGFQAGIWHKGELAGVVGYY